MDKKYYFTSLARRPLTFSGKVFRFMVCSIGGGSATGIFATDDPEQLTILDDAVRGKRGVREIGADEFEELKKKASQTPQRANTNGSKPRVIQPPILPPLAVEERAGVPSAGNPTGKEKGDIFSGPAGRSTAADRTRPSIANLLKLGKVNPPKPFAASEGKVRKASQRADRAKVRVARAAE